jgi:hypothetical protein
MRHQQTPPPLVALTALLAVAAAVLTLWYAPVPLVPRAVFAVLAMVFTVAIAARTARGSAPALAIDVALLYTTATATVLHVVLTAALHILGAAQGWLENARTRPAYATAA